jgi:hypothetical protein
MRGEPNEEDRTVFPPGTENLRVDQQTSQQMLYDTLYSILQQEKIETLTSLVQSMVSGVMTQRLLAST